MNRYDIFNDRDNLIRRFKEDLILLGIYVTQEECVNILQRGVDYDKYFKNITDDFTKKVFKEIVDKYSKLLRGEVLNHNTFKLSNLDLEMIKYVPQGGSWKNIPSSTVNKSKRLIKITQTGGRTTLYGRIDYNKPSYTITTYFNRPGNGTYVHPVHERVISVREAARFQCFPDEYYFCGNKSDKLKQVGNAVPCILAYALGKAIKEKTGCFKSVDLFSGAGGMTYGFKRAGINSVIANEIMPSACLTLKVNNPEINVLCDDITKEDVKDHIIKVGIDSNADIICGGPPCQGFSMAGFRDENDPRNLLFKPFVEIVSKVNPKVVVFENVEGILSYQGGKTYKEVLSLFSELGYIAEGRKLLASEYGVPQKRKRVIILCIRKDLNILPSDVFPKTVTPNSDKQITAFETINDLENIECFDDAKYDNSYQSIFVKMMKGKISIDDYLKSITDKRGKIEIIESVDETEEFDEDE